MQFKEDRVNSVSHLGLVIVAVLSRRHRTGCYFSYFHHFSFISASKYLSL